MAFCILKTYFICKASFYKRLGGFQYYFSLKRV
ncbi:hypothetical protein TDE_1358 [Treponema denticola ATCC 35405]|uniref:Uncharacterized protein n=1 Tax=Treponema denticola (strain ATCC 35405 / DSM 14222 / CIP 103919 / JCM 8153 / KCTC 15104) TaxID=243275 RepID=Q73MZ8_TREDE|nr:hypothetical protein TDE_1358 [Treponema denticola ATCC 35405]